MKIKTLTYNILSAILLCLCSYASAYAQTQDTIVYSGGDEKLSLTERFNAIEGDTLNAGDMLSAVKKGKKGGRDWTKWKPEPKRAMWMAMVFPGGGQIYNRKYWKLPFIYGGFVGCAYAWSWNNKMYRDYRQAYLDIMDDDDNTHSYDQFLHFGNKIDDSNKDRYKDIFSKRKDRFRRYRDMSFFCILGVYAISVIDAYVDASLSEFDISDDLSLQIEPTYLVGQYNNPLRQGGLGVQCNIKL